jgi:hypothetical protein
MMRNCAFLVLLLLSAAAIADDLAEFDRSGSIYISSKIGYTLPSGPLANGDYQGVASSWRKDGYTVTGEVGYYLSNSSIGGIELSYSSFNPKRLTALAANGSQDHSRVRIRRFELFFQYQMIPTGRFRPFLKLGAGIFDISRFSMPLPGSSPLSYRDYSLSAKPVFSAGVGITAYISPRLSAAVSVEGVNMNSCSGFWETSGASLGPINENMMFLPVYVSVAYHLSN